MGGDEGGWNGNRVGMREGALKDELVFNTIQAASGGMEGSKS